ncbi:MAG: signal peptide peptidase SppA [Hyphomicrobiales bacterium]
MKHFFRSLLASIIGSFVGMAILLIVFFVVIVGASMKLGKQPVKDIQTNSVLKLTLDYPLNERTIEDPFATFSPSLKGYNGSGLTEVIKALDSAAEDNKIKGVYLELSDIPAGMATIQALRKAISDFRKSGKFVYAYSKAYSQKAYYLGSVADEVYLHPMGAVIFQGLNAQIMFYKNLLNKLDIDVQVIRHGKFKSAVEPFILDKMSAANEEQTRTYLNSIWGQIVDGVSQSRNISGDELNNIADLLTGFSAKNSLETKLVDKLLYDDEMIALLKEKTGINEDEDIKFVTPQKYIAALQATKKPNVARDRVAVIYAIGEIKQGEGSDKVIGSARISKAIREARLDDRVKAIVVRVNSPGGDALASDVIGREIILAKKVKPVVISMGDLAASGGYWISAHGSRIFAEPTTITGSIGVFGMLPNIQGLLNNLIGVNISEVSTNSNSDFGSLAKPLSPYQRNIIQQQIETIYDDFTTWVAEGRGLTKTHVDSIGQGRVWSGADAIKIGLVDEFGGLKDAVNYAAKEANVSEYRIINLPEPIDPFKKIFEQYLGQAKMAEKVLGKHAKYYNDLKSVIESKGVQAKLPYCIEIN